MVQKFVGKDHNLGKFRISLTTSKGPISLNGPPEPILAAIPSLHAGEFILLSPDHLASAQRLSVRGLATRHEVVPEEKFREILGTGAVVATDPVAEDRSARRRRSPN